MSSMTIETGLPLCIVIVPKDQPEKMFDVCVCIDLRIREESQRKGAKVAQCFRCQRYGHTVRFCRVLERCVKCAGYHTTEEKIAKDRPNRNELREIWRYGADNITLQATRLGIEQRFTLNGYTIHRKDGHNRGGGTAILITCGMEHCVLQSA